MTTEAISDTAQNALESTLLAQNRRVLAGSGKQNKDALPPRSEVWRAKSLSLDETHHIQVAYAAKVAEGFMLRMLRDLRDKGTWLLMSGQTGCGKSHIARAIARYWDTQKIDAWSKGWIPGNHVPNSEYVVWPLAVDAGRDSWREWLDQIRSARLVVLDDVGAEPDRYRSGEPSERLREVLEVVEKKWIVITTNIMPEQWLKRFGQRVADRLNAAVCVGMWDVPSYRGKLK